jgi:hypothetical protein
MPAISGSTNEAGAFHLARGPLHARIFYKVLGLGYFSFGRPSLYDLYLLDCELKDIRDEIERRVKRQKTAEAT